MVHVGDPASLDPALTPARPIPDTPQPTGLRGMAAIATQHERGRRQEENDGQQQQEEEEAVAIMLKLLGEGDGRASAGASHPVGVDRGVGGSVPLAPGSTLAPTAAGGVHRPAGAAGSPGGAHSTESRGGPLHSAGDLPGHHSGLVGKLKRKLPAAAAEGGTTQAPLPPPSQHQSSLGLASLLATASRHNRMGGGEAHATASSIAMDAWERARAHPALGSVGHEGAAGGDFASRVCTDLAGRTREERTRMAPQAARRKQMEQVNTLVEALLAYREVVEAAPDLILVVSPDAHATIRFANAAVARALRVEPSALLGASFLSLVHAADQSLLAQTLGAMVGATDLPGRARCRLRNLAAGLRVEAWLDVDVTMRFQAGRGVICFIR